MKSAFKRFTLLLTACVACVAMCAAEPNNDVKKVLVMSVNPGNAGQMYLPYVGKKIDKMLRLKEELGFKVYWDGACSADKITTYAPKGVDGFVLGTTLLFGKERDYKDIISDIRKLDI